MNTGMLAVLQGIMMFLEVLCWLILANSILSWVMPMSKVHDFTQRLCEPLLRPFRGLSQKMTRGRMPVDFSPTLAILAMLVLTLVLSSVASML